jgi:maltose/moltooligosaccharide transporter
MATPLADKKPRLGFWDIWNMSFGFLGIQFGFALQGGFMSRIFKDLGAADGDLPLLWLAGPLTGFIVQPLIGYLSDRTWGRFGRRKPYFLIGAILSSVALVIMPNSPALWVAAGMLWILDASINISMEPFRALVADKLPASQRTFGFTMQSVLIGFGAVLASASPKILAELGVATESVSGQISPHLRWSFYIGAFFFISTILWTVFKTKEYPPEDLEAFRKEKESSGGFMKGLSSILGDIVAMPKTMKQLAVVQFFTWFGLFTMWTFAFPAIVERGMGLSKGMPGYESMGDTVGLFFGMMNLIAMFFAFLLPKLANATSRKFTHMCCMALGGIGLISIMFIHSEAALYISFGLIGIAWASILSMPYAILAGALPPQKMGIYMGIFNFFIVIPQIIASAGGLTAIIEGLFSGVDKVTGEAVTATEWAMPVAGFCFLLAAISVLFVTDVSGKDSKI